MTLSTNALASKCIESCRKIATFSEDAGNTTRTYLSAPTHQVHKFLRRWMSDLAMESSVDAAGNLRGVVRGTTPEAPRLLIGSHIDTVPNAGAYDGVLGVVLALALIEALDHRRLDYDLEVVAFSEEEGVRFGVPFLGSRALVSDLDESLLSQRDRHGITVAQAIRHFGLDPSNLSEAALHPATFGYLEFHIEQGPVLEEGNTGLGVVEAIAGQSRCQLTFHGEANHAGTTPMHLRRDALAGAAEWVLAVEREASTTAGLVATVGCIEAVPGVANVIPGEAAVSLDLRHPQDPTRIAALNRLLAAAQQIAGRRRLKLGFTPLLDQAATPMHPSLAAALEAAAVATGSRPRRMPSGAGHDAMILARQIPAAMLFLRSPGGLSHHPDEAVRLEDIQAALAAGLYFLKHLDPGAIVAETTALLPKGTDCNHSD